MTTMVGSMVTRSQIWCWSSSWDHICWDIKKAENHLGMAWTLQNHFLWHTSSNKATSPYPSQAVPLIDDQTFKYMSVYEPLSLKLPQVESLSIYKVPFIPILSMNTAIVSFYPMTPFHMVLFQELWTCSICFLFPQCIDDHLHTASPSSIANLTTDSFLNILSSRFLPKITFKAQFWSPQITYLRFSLTQHINISPCQTLLLTSALKTIQSALSLRHSPFFFQSFTLQSYIGFFIVILLKHINNF